MIKTDSPEELLVSVFWSPSQGNEPYEGKAAAVTSENQAGKFDILPQHVNFISLIKNKLIVHTLDKKEVEYAFTRGVLEVSNNKVSVYLGL